MTQYPGSPRPPRIDDYAPPRQRGPVLWIIVAAAVLVVVVLAGIFTRSGSGAASPTRTPSPVGTTPAGPGLPFTMPSDPSSTGRWEILDHVWGPTGVTAEVRVWADAGVVSYGFIAFTNTGADIIEPAETTLQPPLTTGTLRAGGSATGYVFLPMERGDATLILTTAAGRQISALPIPG